MLCFQHKGGHRAGRVQKSQGVPRERKRREMRRWCVGSSEGQPAAARDAVRPQRLVSEKPSRDSPADGTNIHVSPLTAVGLVSLWSRGGRGRAGRRARLHGARGAAVTWPLPLLRPSPREPAALPVCLFSCSASRRFSVPRIAFTSRHPAAYSLLLTFSPFHPHYSHATASSLHRASTGTLLCSPSLI